MSPKKFIQRIQQNLQQSGWDRTGGKKLNGIVVFKFQKDTNSKFVLVVPSNNDTVTENHIQYLLQHNSNSDTASVAVAAQPEYTQSAQTLVDEYSIETISVPDANSTSIQSSDSSSIIPHIATNNISRRKALVGGGSIGGVFVFLLFSNILNATESSIGGGIGQDPIADVTLSEDGEEFPEIIVDVSDESLVTNVALRDESGEIVKRTDASSGATHATIPIADSLSGEYLEPGSYDVVVTEEDEIIDTESVELSTADVEISDVSMIAPAEDQHYTDLYTNFEIEISASGGILPIEFIDGALTGDVPNPISEPRSDRFPQTIEPGDTLDFTFGFGDSGAGVFPVASRDNMECSGEQRTATAILLLTTPGSNETFETEVTIEYEIAGEYTRGGRNGNQNGCTDGTVVEYSVE